MSNKETLSSHLDYVRSIDLVSQELESAVSLYKVKLITALQNQDHSNETIERLDKIKEMVKNKVEILHNKR